MAQVVTVARWFPPLMIFLLPAVNTIHHGGPVARLLSVKSEFSFVKYSAHIHPVCHARDLEKIPTLEKPVFYWGRWAIKKITESRVLSAMR